MYIIFCVHTDNNKFKSLLKGPFYVRRLLNLLDFNNFQYYIGIQCNGFYFLKQFHKINIQIITANYNLFCNCILHKLCICHEFKKCLGVQINYNSIHSCKTISKK